MNQLQILGAIEIGLIYSFVAIGVYITFKIIDFPDLTVDGSFTLGAAVSSAMIFAGHNPFVATIAAIIAGSLAGGVTGYLNVKWSIMGLLSGILTMTGLYSINLRIMGRPNIAIIDASTIFSNWNISVVTFCTMSVLILILYRFFISDFGLATRAIGINPKVSSSYGINVGSVKITALAISNGIVAFAGSLFAQSQGFADISMGMGTIVIGLASVIIGDAIINASKIWIALVTCALGSILYRIAIGLALNANDIGLEASDLNLITACMVAVTMMAMRLKKT